MGSPECRYTFHSIASKLLQLLLWYPSEYYTQGCTNAVYHVLTENKLCTVAPNNSECPVYKLFYVAFLVPKFWLRPYILGKCMHLSILHSTSKAKNWLPLFGFPYLSFMQTSYIALCATFPVKCFYELINLKICGEDFQLWMSSMCKFI
jgi:hypothetical protein